MSRRLAVAFALVGLVLLAASARADDLSRPVAAIEDDSESPLAGSGTDVLAAASEAQPAIHSEEHGGRHHKKHEKHHSHHDKHLLKEVKHEKCRHGKHRGKHGWWHALEKRAEAVGEALEDRAEELTGDDGALAALGACLAIGAGALAAWLVHRRRVQAAAAKRAGAHPEGSGGPAGKGEQAPLLGEEQGKQA